MNEGLKMANELPEEEEFPIELLDRIIQDVVRSAKHRYLEAGSSARQAPQSAKNKIEQHLNRHNQ